MICGRWFSTTQKCGCRHFRLQISVLHRHSNKTCRESQFFPKCLQPAPFPRKNATQSVSQNSPSIHVLSVVSTSWSTKYSPYSPSPQRMASREGKTCATFAGYHATAHQLTVRWDCEPDRWQCPQQSPARVLLCLACAVFFFHARPLMMTFPVFGKG